MGTAKYASEKRKLKESQIPYICKLEGDDDLKRRFVDLLKNNYLLNYFNIQKKKTGKDWIDLEREIKSIISEFRIVESELKKSNQSTYALKKEQKIQALLRELGLNVCGGKDLNAIKLASIHEALCKCLDSFSISYKSSQVVKHVVKGEKLACSTLKAGKSRSVMFIAKTRNFAIIFEEMKDKSELLRILILGLSNITCGIYHTICLGYM